MTGIIRSEDKDAITLVTANETLTIPRPEVEERKPSEQSMMPEGLWATLTDHETRSLVAYLASPTQVPMLATKENLSSLFNGRDLPAGTATRSSGRWRTARSSARPAAWLTTSSSAPT